MGKLSLWLYENQETIYWGFVILATILVSLFFMSLPYLLPTNTETCYQLYKDTPISQVPASCVYKGGLK